jgi:hypothetical protein
MPRMQTLGISNAPRSDNFAKRLLWPSIQNSTDVDTPGVQGYWVCSVVALVSLATALVSNYVVIGIISALLFYIGGLGVREHNRYAAISVFAMYMLGFGAHPGIIAIIVAAILLSNVRATWIASRWQAKSDESTLPPRLNQTLGDKFADGLPQWLWPKLRIAYYICSACLLSLLAYAYTAQLVRPH